MTGRGRGSGRARGAAPRGRGRGRGRGGASASNDVAPAAAASSSSTNDPANTPAPDAIMTDAPAATQPSETAGADASSSSQADPAPAAAAARATTAVRGGRAGGRFMPRAIRRSQLDREAIAAQETAKVEDKATLDARLKRATRGGRGGGRRARGGPPASFDRIIRGGSGGFGSGIQSTGTSRPFLDPTFTTVSDTLTVKQPVPGPAAPAALVVSTMRLRRAVAALGFLRLEAA